MKIKYFYYFAFFVIFFRISFLYSSAYLSVFFSGFVIIAMMKVYYRNLFIKLTPAFALLLLFLIFLYSFVLDIYSGNLWSHTSQSFSFRIIFMFLCSIVPAFYIVVFYLKGSKEKLKSCLKVSFALQLVFFIASYTSPTVKAFLYGLMGTSNSVNLNEFNLNTRGFGLSNEINFTTPFIMVVLSLYFFNGVLGKAIIFFSQVVNSNNSIVAAIISLIFSKVSFFSKLLITVFSFLIISLFAIQYLPRLSHEIAGGGLQTVSFLVKKHLFFINEGLLEHLGGTAIYIYGGASKYLSDMGFVIIYNFGGMMVSILFLLFIIVSAIHIGISRSFSIMWILIGCVLNTKGLLLGANSYIFMTFVFIFNSKFNQVR